MCLLPPIITFHTPPFFLLLILQSKGFTNALHTVTVSQGETAVLRTIFGRTRLNRFLGELRWRRIQLGTTNHVDIPECNGQLSCSRSPSQLVEGIYECYRVGRSLRTWHPLFYLFVRGKSKFYEYFHYFPTFIFILRTYEISFFFSLLFVVVVVVGASIKEDLSVLAMFQCSSYIDCIEGLKLPVFIISELESNRSLSFYSLYVVSFS